MFGPQKIRHPNGPLRPPLAMRLRRRLLRSRRTKITAISAYAALSLGLIGVLAHLGFG